MTGITHYRKHMIIHNKPVKCPRCSQAVSCNRELERHVEVYHTATADRKSFLCVEPSCNVVIRREDNMKRHVKNKHPERRVAD